MYKFKTIFISLLLLPLWGCQSLQTASVKSITIDYQNRSTLEFTGRGAAAGMMMSGSMGAMGIAIGVAIDEGISKDLHLSAKKGGFILEDEVANILTKNGYKANNKAVQTLALQHLGFRASGDLIVPWVEVTLITKSDNHLYRFADIAGDKKVAYELHALKNDPKLAGKVLSDALALVFEAVLFGQSKASTIGS